MKLYTLKYIYLILKQIVILLLYNILLNKISVYYYIINNFLNYKNGIFYCVEYQNLIISFHLQVVSLAPSDNQMFICPFTI